MVYFFYWKWSLRKFILIVNEILVKFFWFNNLHFLMEDGFIQLSAGQDEFFTVVMSLLFFIALFKDI